MRKVSSVVGTAILIDRDSIDTDQIIPSRYLKKITRTGYADGLFAEWRKDPSFPLNDRARRAAQILITGANFGCGSSREHAAWALDEWGFRAIIAPSFADIFRTNALKVGLVPVALSTSDVEVLSQLARDPSLVIEIDIEAQVVRVGDITATFSLDDFTRTRLREGLDDIALTLRHEAEISAHEALARVAVAND